MKRKFDDTLAVVVREYDNSIAVNLERDKKTITIRLYERNDSETSHSAIQFASVVADITQANWQSIDRSGLSAHRPFVEIK